MSERSTGRLLAGLVSYGRSEESVESVGVSEALGVLSVIANELLAGLGGVDKWKLLLSEQLFMSALARHAAELLAKQRAEHALSWFQESTLVGLDRVAFGRLVEQESLRREAQVLAALGLADPAADIAFLQAFRRRLLAKLLWEKLVGSLPAVFLLMAAVVAVGMLLRVLKLPG